MHPPGFDFSLFFPVDSFILLTLPFCLFALPMISPPFRLASLFQVFPQCIEAPAPHGFVLKLRCLHPHIRRFVVVAIDSSRSYLFYSHRFQLCVSCFSGFSFVRPPFVVCVLYLTHVHQSSYGRWRSLFRRCGYWFVQVTSFLLPSPSTVCFLLQCIRLRAFAVHCLRLLPSASALM